MSNAINCPCCGKQPMMWRVHNEVLVECCQELDEWTDAEEMDLAASYSAESAIAQWNSVVMAYHNHIVHREAA